MKVISLNEPYASLIKNGFKQIETRSWKTNYRGEIYIHASLKELHEINNDLKVLVQNIKTTPGYIVCKAFLSDCIYMTEQYVEDIKKNHYQEFICGDFRPGRYALVLKNIEVIDPVLAKGALGIWNYYTPKEIFLLMQSIQYGWVNQNKVVFHDTPDNDSNYYVQSPQEVLQSKVGTCFDDVELERYYFQGHLNVQSYFLFHFDGQQYHSHTFLTYQENDQFYWFEYAWEKYRGIHRYPSLEKLLIDVKRKFSKDETCSLFAYPKPKTPMKANDFVFYCQHNSKNIDLF